MPTATKDPVPVEWEPSHTGTALAGLLAIGTGKKRTVYAVVRIPSDRGAGFHLEKVEGTGTDKEEAGYDCCLAGQWSDCSCRGFQAHRKCKHIEALSDLLVANQL